MPHLVIEYSAHLQAHFEPSSLMQALCEAVSETGIARKSDLKARLLPYEDVLLNDGSTGFIHLTLSLLAGRSPEQKELLGVACRRSLIASCPDADAISIDIRDMDPRAYKKRVRIRS